MLLGLGFTYTPTPYQVCPERNATALEERAEPSSGFVETGWQI